MSIHNRLREQSQEVISLTSLETEKYLNLSLDNPTLLEWMKSKGLDFDQGIIDISLNGFPAKLNTNKENFGKISI